ncbi:MAG TPA: hypothetical protein ENN09_00955 [Planctomycetes bacterium]|nr:hypothetical protein [Planctomycetota bacterium]
MAEKNRFQGERKDRGTMKASIIRFTALLVLGLVFAGFDAAGEEDGRPGFGRRRQPTAEEKKEEAAPAPAPQPVAEPAPAQPAPAPAPVTRTRRRRDEEARTEYRRLDEVAKELSLRDQERYAEADASYRAGLSAYEAAEFDTALKMFEQAVTIFPNHKGAQDMLTKTRELLNIRSDTVAGVLKRMSFERRAKVQEALLELRNAVEKAEALENQAKGFREGDTEKQSDELLTRRIRFLDEAIEQYDRVLEIIKWMPFEIDLSAERAVAMARRAAAAQDRKQSEENLAAFQRSRAARQAEEARQLERSYLAHRVKTMLDQANLYYGRREYERCEELCQRIMKVDPLNTSANSLLAKSRQARHKASEQYNYNEMRIERRESMLNVEEAAIPHSRRIIYPEDWERIVARSEQSGGMASQVEAAWEQDIRRKLDKRVSFEFVQTPLSEAVQFLQNLTKVNMILDPVALQEVADAPITLRVSQMKLELALDWILRLAGLQYMLKDNAIFISKPDRLTADIVLRIFDVRDLTMKVQNFPGPDFALDLGTSAFGQSGLGGIQLITAEEEDAVTAESLADMIQNKINPESWSPDLGTSIELSGGKLIVMQRPEVHRMIDKLLASLRSTQKLQVTVEGRVLVIREGFFEEIGFDWSGLNTITRPPVNTNVIGRSWTSQTFNPDAAVNPPLSAVSSGYVRRPTGFYDGNMHIVGAISNYRPNASPEEGTIGSEAFNSTLWEERLLQGLNGQYIYLSNLEAMSFMHLLRVRESGTVLTAPRLTVFNTQRAHMFVAEQQAYVADYDVSGSAYDPIIRQFLQGVVFEVRPIVSSDRRYITLEMRPTLATLIEMDTINITGVMVYDSDPPLIIRMILPVDFPVIELRKVRTTVTLPDGGLVLLGGIMQNIKFRAENGVPFISNIPIIGRLFRWTVEDNEKRNLSVMVRAKLLMFEEEERKL